MKNKNGFTLVELLATIVLIGLLMAIAVPSALKLSSKVKTKAYNTKIELIEAAGNLYGQSNLSFVRRGTDPDNLDNHYTCTMTYDNNDITKINYVKKSSGYSETASLKNNEFWCIQLTVQDLIDSNNLDYDEKSVCNGKCTDSEKADYDNIVTNPKTNYIINKCYVYVYYKYNRVYTVFDDETCNNKSETPIIGREYRRLA